MSIAKVFMASRSGWGQLLDFLPKTAGANGVINVGKNQLKLIRQFNPEARRFIDPFLKQAENPVLTIAYKNPDKARTAYSIAALRMQDGERVIGTGALSITKPGTAESVMKARLSIGENGQVIRANGYLDGSKTLDAEDFAAGVMRRGGKLKGDVECGGAAGVHATGDEGMIVKILKSFGVKNNKPLDLYNRAVKEAQANLNDGTEKLRYFLQGGDKAKFPKAQNVIAKVQAKPLTDAEKEAITKVTKESIAKGHPDFANEIAKAMDSKDFEAVRGIIKRYGVKVPKSEPLSQYEKSKFKEVVDRALHMKADYGLYGKLMAAKSEKNYNEIRKILNEINLNDYV